MRQFNALSPILTLLAAAPSAWADGASLDLNLEQYEPNQDIVLTVTGDPGDLSILLLASATDTVDIPGVGTLGLDLTAGLMQLNLGAIPAGGQLAAQCDLTCDSPILQSPCFLQVVTIDPLTAELCITEVVDLSAAAADCGLCPGNPTPNSVLTDSDRDFGLRLGGLGALEDFVFTGGGEFAEFGDGTARVTGILAARDDADCKLYVELDLAGRINPLDADHAPVGSPVLDLFAGAYKTGGGSIDPGSWHYYGLVDGTARGIDGCLLGARIELLPGASAAQVGLGANGLNGDWGLSVDLGWTVTQQPESGDSLGTAGEGDIAIDVRECPVPDSGPICVTTADAGSEYCTGGPHAVWFSALGKDWRFVGGAGNFYEAPDGTATLAGEIFNTDDPDERFCVDVLLSGLVEPGDASYPPSGSPKLGLCDELYAENGGPVDTDTFRYYTETTGVLVGKGDFDCALIAIDRKGPSFQIGVGANVKNANFGLSGWFDMRVLEQPCNGDHIEDKNGDFNVDIVDCPPPPVPASTDALVHYDFDVDSGSVVVDRMGNMDLQVAANDDDSIEWVVDGIGRGLEFDQDDTGTACVRSADESTAAWLRQSIQGTGAFTVQAAVVVDGDAHWNARLVTHSSTTFVGDRTFTLMAYPEGFDDIDVEARVVTTTGNHYESERVDPEVAEEGDFVVLSMTFDEATGELRAYYDGILADDWSVGGYLTNWDDYLFMLGNEGTGNRAFAGVMYDVKVWNRALTSEELVAEADALHVDA